MAASSILTNFTINDQKAAEKFVEALEAASLQPSRRPTSPVKKPIRDPEAIRAFLAKGKK